MVLGSSRLIAGPSDTDPKPTNLNEEQKSSTSPAVIELGHYDPPEELQIQLAPLIQYYDQNSSPFLQMRKEKDVDFQKYIDRDPSWYYRYYTDWKRWQEEREFSTTPRLVDPAKSPHSLSHLEQASSTPNPGSAEEVESTGSQWVFMGLAVGVSSIIAFIVSLVTNWMHRPGQPSTVTHSIILQY